MGPRSRYGGFRNWDLSDPAIVEFLEDGGMKLKENLMSYLTFQENSSQQEVWLLDNSDCDSSIITIDSSPVNHHKLR